MGEVAPQMFGRREILALVDTITYENIVDVLNEAINIHSQNSAEIDYLFRYMRGQQPVLNRVKAIRPEICNKIVENHASEIVQFTSGYFMGEPCTYVRRGEREGASREINRLNDMMFSEDKSSHDKDISTWMAIGGVGYRMVLPDRLLGDDPDESPFELDTPDPRFTFVVYHAGFGHRRLMGVRKIVRKVNGIDETLYCGYTPTHYFEVKDGTLVSWKPHALGDIPIFEYRLNMAMMGAYEPAVPLLDAINTIASNRVDGLEQFVQSFVKFINCDIDETTFKELVALGAIKVKSVDSNNKADVEIVSQELNQEQTQMLVDYLYDQVLSICGMPTTTKGGSSTSDTGAAVFLRDGWSQCEARARDTELLFKKSEKQFLRLVLHIIRTMKGVDLNLSEIECKFTRRQHDNLVSKSQSLTQMLQAGIKPEVAIATCGLFNDPADVAAQSASFLKKWDYKESPPNSNPGVNPLQ